MKARKPEQPSRRKRKPNTNGGEAGRERYGRRDYSKRPQPRGGGMFKKAILAACDDLDFALRMYAVELAFQNWTDQEIEDELRQAFFKAASKILSGSGGPQGEIDDGREGNP